MSEEAPALTSAEKKQMKWRWYSDSKNNLWIAKNEDEPFKNVGKIKTAQAFVRNVSEGLNCDFVKFILGSKKAYFLMWSNCGCFISSAHPRLAKHSSPVSLKKSFGKRFFWVQVGLLGRDEPGQRESDK